MNNLATAQISFLDDIAVPDNILTLSLRDVLYDIKAGKYKTAIDECRDILAVSGGEAYKAAKKRLPTAHFNGSFQDRLNNENLIASSGLFHFDIDHLKTVQETFELKKEIIALSECVFCFISPSCLGLKGALRISPERVKNDADFKAVFAFCEAYFKKLGITIDPACKDVRRACFMSSDADVYINYDASIFHVPQQQKEQPKQKASAEKEKPESTQDTASICIDRVKNILLSATDGTRHETRLRAGNLAGGYIAGKLIDEQLMLDVLEQFSDSIASNGSTDKSEFKTILDAVAHGKLTPINSLLTKTTDRQYSNQEDGKQHKDSNQDTETPKTKFKLVDVGEIMTVSAKPNWFIDGLFEHNKVGQLFGKSGHGKSFVALDIAYCIATGIDYHGRETSQANVTYICGEGKSGISKRLLALESKYQAGIAGKMTVSEQPGALMKADVMKSMAEAIKEQGGVGLVIVDTYHRNMGGGKEDSSDDFGIILGNIDTYFKPLGVTTLIVHHSGHGASDRGRGSSAMYASYDFEFKAECTPDKKQLKLFNTKQKDDEELKPLLFEFEKRHLLVNDEEVTSLTLNYIGEAVTAKTGKSLNKADELVFLSLYDAIDKYGVSPSHDIKSKFGGFDGINTGKKVVHIRDWRGLVYPLLDVDVSSEKTMDAKKKSFQRARNKLFNTGMIGRFNDYCWPIDREINNRAAA